MPMRSELSSKATRLGLKRTQAISTWTAPTRQQKLNSWLIFVGDQSIAPVVGWLKAIKIREVWNRRWKSLKPAWISCRRLEWKCLSPKVPRWGAKCPLLWAKHGGRLKKVRGHISIRHSNWLGFPIQVGSVYEWVSRKSALVSPFVKWFLKNLVLRPWTDDCDSEWKRKSVSLAEIRWTVECLFHFWFELQLRLLFEKGYFANCNFQNCNLRMPRTGCWGNSGHWCIGHTKAVDLIGYRRAKGHVSWEKQFLLFN